MNVTDLPRSAADKLAHIATAADEAQALALSSTKRVKDANDRLLATDDPKQMANAEHELTRVRAQQGKHQRRYNDLSALLASLQQFVQSISDGMSIGVARPIRLNQREGETIGQTVARVRTEIATTKQEMHATRLAPPPKKDIRAQAGKYVEGLASRGKPRIRVSRDQLIIDFDDPASFGPSASRSICHLAWLWPEEVTAAILKDIDGMPEPGLSLTAKARETRLAELAVALDQLERIEEGLIEAAETQGHVIDRRTDASPLAVLGIMLKTAAEKAA